MADIREQIIVRLLDVVCVTGIVEIARNVNSFDDGSSLPAVAVLDGDEDPIQDEPQRRPPTIPRRFEMTPLVLVAAQDRPETVGTELNTLRALIIKAVLTDSALLSLVDRNGIRYDGLVTPRTENGRMMLGQKFMRFTFTYILDPGQL